MTRIRCVGAAVCAAVAVGETAGPPPARAAAGDPDRSFGSDGRVLLRTGGAVSALLAVEGGRLVGTVGGHHRIGAPFGNLFRLRFDGSRDASFGAGGLAPFPGGGSAGPATPSAVVRQPDGKLVVLGANFAGPRNFTLVRYTKAGRVDPSFGAGGRVEAQSLTPVALGMQRDGALVVAGWACAETSTPRCAFGLVRYSRGGAADPGFGTSGVAGAPFVVFHDDPGEISFGEISFAMAVQADDRIVTAGVAQNDTLALARYLPDGALDRSFGFRGVAGGGLLNEPRGRGALAIAPDGKIVAVVQGPGRNTRLQSWLVRLRRDGKIDVGFGSRGAVSVPGLGLNAVHAMPDGRLTATGSLHHEDVVIARYRNRGRRDRTFGRDGFVFTDVDGVSPSGSENAFAVVLQRGRVVTGGGFGFPDYAPFLLRHQGSRRGEALARYRVIIRRPRALLRARRFHKGDVVTVALHDARRRGERYELCWSPRRRPERTRCVDDVRIGGPHVRIRLSFIGLTVLRFKVAGRRTLIVRFLDVRTPR